jgi:hypothetical protein
MIALPSDMLNRETNSAIADSTIKARLAGPGFTVLHLGSPAAFGKFLVEETEKWGKVVKFAGIKSD